jgi:Rps23 Pro-64 3,4-dihydroxylase Tpa1-like proline 4-hydroxylase
MNTTNLFIDDFINKIRDNTKSISLQKNNCIRISENIIDINPVPIFIKTTINDSHPINTEFNIIASTMKEEELYITKTQDPNKTTGIFTSQNAYVPYNNILEKYNNNIYLDLLKKYILEGISELLVTTYNYNGNYKYTYLNSWIQKYKNGTFLSPHNHVSSSDKNNTKIFSVAYYIDDGDPDTTQTFSGCISFMCNNNLIHLRPKSGTLLIWENNLIHLVNPFYSNSNKERFMLSTNISVEI